MLAYVTDNSSRRRTFSLLEEIAKHLPVNKWPVRALVAQLAADGAIERLIGTQRAIVVPGLLTRVAVEELRAAGWHVYGELRQVRSAQPLPRDNLSLVAIIEHVPARHHGDHHDQHNAA